METKEVKYEIKDIQKGLEYLKKHCNAVYVALEFEELGRLVMKGSDLSGNAVRIIIFDESTQKMAEVTKTERL